MTSASKLNNRAVRAALLAALLATTAAHAQTTTFTFQHGVAGYLGSADTTLRAAEPTVALGSEPEAGVDASDGGQPAQALLRFEGLFGSGAGQIGSERVVTQATLTLTVTSAGSGIRFFEMLQPWNEATATWASLGDGVQADGVEAASTPFLQIGANDGGGNIEAGTLVLDITAALQRQQAGLTAGHGWALLPFMPDGTNGIDFYTREWTTLAERPLLTVVTAPVPEPTTLALWLSGLLAMAWGLKKRRG